MTKQKILFYLFSILTLATMILIFWFSSQNAEKSGAVSLSFTQMVLRFFIKEKMFPTLAEYEAFIKSADGFVRECAHFAIFAFLGLFSCLTLVTCKLKINSKKCCIYAFVFSFIYSLSDEFHQMFVPGRSAESFDIMMDNLGIILGIFVAILIKQLFIKYVRNANR